ncbi:hypothetical protein RNJ44_00588 [Nakaseomyces bracarensis]|uniref:Family 17 glucosidase SCW4 n=1 Tax=Nakaseomyces bracarensis TaxID=273131 RepID=A0ABR4NRL7_9SACH
MQFSKLITALSAAGALAAPANLQHKHNNKRDVVTQTVHNKVTVTAQAGSAAAATVQAGLLKEDVVLGSSNQVTSQAAAVEATTTAAAATEANTVEAASSAQADTESTTQAASTGSSTTSSSSGASGKGITYSPYNNDGSCKSASDVASDLAQLTGYSMIRLYGVDCNQVENVLKAKATGQKLFLGIYYVDQIQAGVDTMKAAIDSYGSWDDVYTVSIGNELVNSGQATTDQVAQYIATGRSALQAAGYTGPVVSVDTFIAVINNPALCEYSDYMGVNAHAYFDQNTVASDAGPWVLQQIQRVWTACGGKKDVLITESGWPSQGETLGVAVASKANQEAAIASIEDTCANDVILFNAFNDYWKADGAYGCEKYWGILSN